LPFVDVECSFEILSSDCLGSKRRSRSGVSSAQSVTKKQHNEKWKPSVRIFSVLNNEDVFKTARLWERYEKPFRKRGRLCYEK